MGGTVKKFELIEKNRKWKIKSSVKVLKPRK